MLIYLDCNADPAAIPPQEKKERSIARVRLSHRQRKIYGKHHAGRSAEGI